MIESLRTEFEKKCRSDAAPLRERFEKTQKGKYYAKQFTEAVEKAIPKNTDYEELERFYDAAYPENGPTRYMPFATIPDIMVLDKLEGSDLMSLVIVNTSDTTFAKFLRRIGATEWAKQGHDQYGHVAEDQCPYCSQVLPKNFEKIFAESFDTEYEENLKSLNAFLTLYRDTANALFVPLQKTPESLLPGINLIPYNRKLDAIKNAIALNIEKIREKTASPAKQLELAPMAPLLQELSEIIDEYNTIINNNNAIVAAGPKKQAECTEAVFSLIAFRLQPQIKAYNESAAALQAEKTAAEKTIKSCEATIRQLQSDIIALNAKTVETDSAKNAINTLLRDSGMQGFQLVPHEAKSHVYKVCREDGSVAENLSEGEKNFIAFLYFYYLVQGSHSVSGDQREKIVVIDDPVSSMDSNSLFIVSSLVRNMIEVCRNNADNQNAIATGNYIKQLFILTHNAFFHREITYNYVNKYSYVSFYLIQKRNNHSSVKLTHEINPNSPAHMRNVNPVKSSYAALWEEYYHCSSSIALLNVIRKILEYYFLQLCGYDGADLRKRVLTDNRHCFVDENGVEDENQYALAQSMLFYISPQRIGHNDGMYYVEESADPDVCRKILWKIFQIMKQEQHYIMMNAACE